MQRSDFHFELPKAQIAQYPGDRRGDSRMLCVETGSGRLTDREFRDFPALLNPGDVLVLNDTRVIPARLHGYKASGGKVEVLVERITAPQEVLAHVRASKSPAAGTRLQLEGDIDAVVTGRSDGLFMALWHLRLAAGKDLHNKNSKTQRART